MQWKSYNGVEYISNGSYEVGVINCISKRNGWYIATDGYKEELMCIIGSVDESIIEGYLNKDLFDLYDIR